jgi:alanyl-tRNA synthetase
MTARTFPGATLFELKATHGFPIEFALDRIIDAGFRSVDWPGFIEAARSNEWWDFQTMRVLEEALRDSMLTQSVKRAISDGCKNYILAHRHPRA